MLNHIDVQGRMVKNPELRTTQSGTSVASFTLAVERDVPNQDGTRETDFIDCVAFKGTAEFAARNLEKGNMVIASGRLQIRNWEDKNGNKRRNAEVIVSNLYFGSSKSDNPRSSKPSYPEKPNWQALEDQFADAGFTAMEGSSDDLPF